MIERELWERLRAVEVRLEHQDEIWAEREKRLNERWRAQDAAVDAAFAAQKEALAKATSELDARLELLNELRGNVLPRAEFDAKHEALRALIDRNTEDLTDLAKTVAVGAPELQVLRREADRAEGGEQANQRDAATANDFYGRLLASLALVVSIAAAVALIVHG